MTTKDDGSAAQLPALQRIKQKLETTRANLPKGASEPTIDAGLVIAQVLIDEEIQALNDSDDPPESVQVCYEAYQVVGSLLSDLDMFNTDHAVKILDNLSEARMVHQDVLPWPSLAYINRSVDGLPPLPVPAFPAVDTADGNDKFTATQMRDYGRATLADRLSASIEAWNHTTAELAAIYGEMAALNETQAKEQNDAQRDRLKALRAEAVEIGCRRYALASPAAPKVVASEPAGFRRATAEEEAAVDVALGLELLPPIRLPKEVAELLKVAAAAEGVIVQAHVRQLLCENLGAAKLAEALRAMLGEFEGCYADGEPAMIAARAALAAWDEAKAQTLPQRET